MSQEAIWNAINEYAAACGGDTSDKTISDRRMDAVVAVEKAILSRSDDMLFPPTLTAPLSEVLGLMCFKTGPVARILRSMGWTIRERVEDEQATVLHWLTCIALKEGDAWQAKAAEYLQNARKPQTKEEKQ